MASLEQLKEALETFYSNKDLEEVETAQNDLDEDFDDEDFQEISGLSESLKAKLSAAQKKSIKAQVDKACTTRCRKGIPPSVDHILV